MNKFLDCGDLERDFVRLRCEHCQHKYLLAFACMGRWFCPACHQKMVQLFGALLSETILFPVVDKGLRPVDRAHMLRGWVYSGFNIHLVRQVQPDEREKRAVEEAKAGDLA